MFVNYKIPLRTLTGQTPEQYINIPISIEYQNVDNSELIESFFVEKETQKAVNPILNYDKVRFTPVKTGGTFNSAVSNITFNINLLDQNSNMQTTTYYSTVDPTNGFTNDDLIQRNNFFKLTYIKLSFYDDDNAMLQNLITEVDLFLSFDKTDYWTQQTLPSPNPSNYLVGQLKPASLIKFRFSTSNRLFVKDGYYEGFNIFTYKDDYEVNLSKFLYMKASLFNAKTGKFTNLISDGNKYNIDELSKKTYTRYVLFRNNSGFYYTLDQTYSNNITFTTNPKNSNNFDISINLYQIQVN